MNIIMLLSVLWCMLLTIIPSCCSQASSMNMSMSTRCSQFEREALLKFKDSLTDPSNRLRSWAGEDCCNWAGIQCDNNTGHVIQLDIRNPHPFNMTRCEENSWTGDPIYTKSCLVGKEVNPSLLDLKHLRYLDLSWNNFSGMRIPNFFGSFSELRYLNLSTSYFGGVVPHHLGNLSTLHFLDLNLFGGDGPKNYGPQLSVDSLHWVSRLSNLKYLDMSFVDLGQASNPMQAINSIPHLLELHLPHSRISSQNLQLSISNLNLTSLVVLDLSYNILSGCAPDWLGQLHKLRHLDLSMNLFVGHIPPSLWKLSSLRHLRLSENDFDGSLPESLGQLTHLEDLLLDSNSFSGPLPQSLGKLSSLRVLSLSENYFNGSIPESLEQLSDLEDSLLDFNSFSGPLPSSLRNLSSLRLSRLNDNNFNGPIPENLGQLSDLVELSLYSNSFEGVLSDIHFANLSNLKFLDLSSNSLILKPKSDWIPPFQLHWIGLGSCRLGPKFPMWLKTQRQFSFLDISHANIRDLVPGWFFDLSNNSGHFHDLYLDLSYNQLYGRAPNIFSPRDIYLHLEHNNFEGPLPHLPSSASIIDVSYNSFSGPIHHIGVTFPNLFGLLLFNNSFNGTIPQVLCEMESLLVLDLSMNHLSGHIPQCLSNLWQLKVLDLSSNNISGVIPSSISKLVQLESLHLSKNKLLGQIPLSLKNCTSLITLDLGENKLYGNIPTWIGAYLSSLKILKLRRNKINGIIPLELCRLIGLQVLDLAHNNISGTIPRCFSNFSGMILNQSIGSWSIGWDNNDHWSYFDKIMVSLNGREMEYSKTLPLVTGLDVSNNNLVGRIPEELMILSALRSLDLSNNNLRGSIPKKIGKLVSLESLDLSENQFSGRIPKSMSDLTFLSHLNLSHNKLSGEIPSDNQFQTFEDPSIYTGNPELCGALLNKCSEVLVAIDVKSEKAKSGIVEINWFYIGITCGHTVGFWGVCGVLFFNMPLRVAYFHFLNCVKDWLLVKIAQVKRRLMRNQVDG